MLNIITAEKVLLRATCTDYFKVEQEELYLKYLKMRYIKMKRIKQYKVLIFIFLLISIIFVGCSSNTKETTKIIPVEKFAKLNHTSFNDLNEGDNPFSLLYADIKDNEVFLTGEMHGMAENFKLKMHLIKYFKQKAGIKYNLIEESYSVSQILNNYLQSGDENILKGYFNQIKKSGYIYNKDNYNSYKDIYKYNRTLPTNQKLKFIGIDIEHNLPIAFEYLKSIIPKGEDPKEIRPILNEVIAVNSSAISREKSKDLCLRLVKSLSDNNIVYENYFKGKLFEFEQICQNIINSADVYKSIQDKDTFDEKRDKYMYDNFMKIYSKFPKGKYFGQLGFDHILQSHSHDVIHFASYLNGKDSLLRGKVLSIAYLYIDSIAMSMNSKSVQYITSYQESTLDDYLQSKYTMFKLTGKGSPFENSLIWSIADMYYPKPTDDNVTTEFYQYMVVIKNAHPTQKMQ